MNAKKILLSLLGAFATICLSTSSLLADTFGLFTYSDNGTSITITNYPEEATGVVDVPATIAGKPVTSIGANAFSLCNGLTNITIPSSVTSIDENAFFQCSGLTSFTIPSGVTSIGIGAFYLCGGLTSIIIPSGVTMIEPYTFSECGGLTSVTIPNSITGIGEHAFNLCDDLTSVDIPSSVISIGNVAFESCRSLTSVFMQEGVTSIGAYAFADCTVLTDVTIPNSVTTISQNAFSECSALTSINIPSGVTSLGNYVFEDCSSLTSITVDAANPSYSSLDGTLFNKAQTALIKYPPGNFGSYTIPSGVTSIRAFAFSTSTGLTSVTIPSSVTSIGVYAFSECSSLTSATYLGNAPNMGSDVFSSTASGFTTYYIPTKTGFTSPLWNGYPAVALVGEVTVEGPGGVILADGSGTVSLGSATVGSAGTPKIFKIKNNGSVNLIGIVITKNGTNASEFKVGAPSATTVPSGQSATFTVTLKPTALGSRSASIHIESNDPDKSPFDIDLTATGTPPSAPEIDVKGPGGGSLTDGTASNGFGKSTVGVKGTSKTYTIKNTGNATLTGISITKGGDNPGDYQVTGPDVTTLAAGASATFEVVFKPKAVGDRSAVLHIKSNDSNEGSFEIEVTGTGIAPEPEIVLEQPVGTNLVDGTASKNFGSVKIGKPGKSKTFTISNTGLADLTGLSIDKTGVDKKEFTVGAPGKTTLVPGESTTFKVTFKPKFTGTRKATIHLMSNDGNESPFDIKLTGEGTVP